MTRIIDARGRLADVGRRSDELDTRGGQVVPVELAKLVRRDLPDKRLLVPPSAATPAAVLPAEPPLT